MPGKFASFYGAGWVDASRFTWLTNELAQAQTDNELVILACHIPFDNPLFTVLYDRLYW
ncbi:MAG: hypothetical protein JXR40_02990 [Pontiellaceae bacterium]|nr:hypothetical protein [Pontiellaceae bacterium]